MKGGDEEKKLKSVFCVELPTTCEEQFCGFDVPDAVATVKIRLDDGQEVLCLVLEMMATRDNYKSYSTVDDFKLDFDNLMI